ncbi:MAG: hypothetical protein JSV80_07235, partial [Acidobacteriota bacterium]
MMPLGLMISGLLAVTCPQLPTSAANGILAAADCPLAFQVSGPGPDGQSWNIVFLGDGFTADQLDAYQCAVKLLVEGLLASEPFNRYRDHINFYRLDVASAPPGTVGVAPCQEPCPIESPSPWVDNPPCTDSPEDPLIGQPVEWPGVASQPVCVTGKFGVRYCANTRRCALMWPTDVGHTLASHLALGCTPQADAIVLIGNASTFGGGGHDEQGVDNKLPLAMISLYEIDKPHRWQLLAHELGHTLGLLDEYPNASGEYHERRNLISYDELLASASADPAQLPLWNAWCKPTATPGSALLHQNLRCQFRLDICYCEGSSCCPDPDFCVDCTPLLPTSLNPLVGLWQEAFFANPALGFRSESTCRLKVNSDEYCSACTHWMQDVLLALGVPRCPAPPSHCQQRMLPIEIEPIAVAEGSEFAWTANGSAMNLSWFIEGNLPAVATLPVGSVRALVDLGGVLREVDVD